MAIYSCEAIYNEQTHTTLVTVQSIWFLSRIYHSPKIPGRLHVCAMGKLSVGVDVSLSDVTYLLMRMRQPRRAMNLNVDSTSKFL